MARKFAHRRLKVGRKGPDVAPLCRAVNARFNHFDIDREINVTNTVTKELVHAAAQVAFAMGALANNRRAFKKGVISINAQKLIRGRAKAPREGRATAKRAWYRKQLRKRYARLRRGVPDWVPDTFAPLWQKPWTEEARTSGSFKDFLWKRGYLSPNFTRAEAGSKDGTPIPSHLRDNAQRHAFELEQVRHDCGDQPMRFLSWYRSGTPGLNDGHNAAVGGAIWSRHKEADAVDASDAERIRLGTDRFDASMRRNCPGIGTYQGHVRHGDQGPARTWSYG